MKISIIDIGIVISYVLFAIGLAAYYSKRASKNINEYFVSGRNLPWWVAGTSMVATTFAADTPLAITGIIAKDGISGNWLWWNGVLSGMLSTFLFARLWRRSGVITDVELAELRYDGKAASALRGFRAFYTAIPINCITMGWVLLAMQKIVVLVLGVPDTPGWKAISVLICLIFVGLYSMLSGFWGVVMTDLVQFGIAMFGSITLAIVSLSKIGGITQLKEQLAIHYSDSESLLNIFPDFSVKSIMLTFGVYLGVQWWASNGVDGGGYIAQRMFASRDEKHTLLATFWFNIAHYTLRPWPWIIVGLVSMVVYPNLEDPEVGYPMIMLKYMPVGLLGIMMTSFLASFMSTIDTHLNWGSSYLVNDFYKRFIRTDADDQHYVGISRICVLIIMVCAGVISLFMDSISEAWKFLIALNAGIGLVQILRWYWWRINAWSEISAMFASAITSIIVFSLPLTKDSFALQMLIIVPVSTTVWVSVTLLTEPVSEQRLLDFYQRVRPSGGFWGPITSQIDRDLETDQPDSQIDGGQLPGLVMWILGAIFIYSTLFAVGKIVLGFYLAGIVSASISILSGSIVISTISKIVPPESTNDT
tara:strand:- start:1290 stop:3059 length:1770 start_codon:yes stop_codon:yes gene_type:complete